MGCGPPLKGKIMEFTLAEEAEFLEQENLKANQVLAQPGPDAVVIEAQAVVVKVEPVAEITKIIDLKDRIAAYMAPALEDELKGIVKMASSIVKVTTTEEREKAAEQATKCQKGRTLKVEAQHAEFKAPVTAVGRLFDNRKTALSAIVKTEEDRIRLLIADFDKKEADRLAEIERLRKLKVSGRINDLASRGLMVDAEFAEVATDGEWELHVADLVKEKEESDRKAREEQARKDAAQKRIVGRMEIASKLGVEISRDDAELLSDEAFEEERDKWVIAYNQREEEAIKLREETDLVKRAGEAGFALQQCDIDQMRVMISEGQFADIEAAFMLWLDDSVKHKAINDAKLLAAARLEKRMAQVEEFSIEAAISVLKNATDEEWDSIVAAAKPAPVEVPVVATPAPAAIAVRCTPELVAAVEEGKARAGIAAPIASAQVVEETLAAQPSQAFDGTKLEMFVAHIRSIAGRRMAEKGDDFNPADWFGGNFDDAYFGGVEDGSTEMARDVLLELETLLVVREELGQVFQSFKDFGNKHCTKELRADFTVVYLKLKALVERV